MAAGASLFLAHNKLRQLDYEGCILLCDALLGANPRDQRVWLLKCRALTQKVFIDDSDLEEEGTVQCSHRSKRFLSSCVFE